MIRAARHVVAILLLLLTLPVAAQTRAWLDRSEITYGETATLNIETDQSVQSIDYRALETQFDIAGQTVRRSFGRSASGMSTRKSLFAVGIRPRGPGVLTVPALKVGASTTPVLRMTVLPPSVLPASGDADVFVESVVDAPQPYVQQAVGLVVRLHYAVPLMSGQLDQEPPANASMQRVGEDLTYQRDIDGRRFNVVERRFLLIPERSGPLVLPGARFNGMTAGGFFDQIFDDGRKPLSAAAPIKRLQVQPIPANAPQPWLPLRDLKLRYLQAPKVGKVGEATTVEIEAIADGASASQLPGITMPDADGVQVFADPPQSDERFIEARPRTTLRRRIALVPTKPGTVELAGPRIEWWDAAQGVTRTAMLPPLRLEVAPGTTSAVDTPDAARQRDPDTDSDTASKPRGWLWGALAALVLAGLAGWRMRERKHVDGVTAEGPSLVTAHSQQAAPALEAALKGGDLAAIAQALSAEAGVQGEQLDAVHARLDDAGQQEAVRLLQAARWAGGDADAARAALRRAFAKGARWRQAARRVRAELPPLYPE